MRENNELTPIWIVNCMEYEYPGMWQRWFRNQCVAIGWPPKGGYRLDDPRGDRAWDRVRSALHQMEIGDRVVVALRDRRVGRIGEVTGMEVGDDEWNPLVPVGPELEYGEMGRRIHVRWDLITGPSDFDLVVQLPSEMRIFSRPTISRKFVPFDDVVREMNNPANWISPGGRFRRESALRDYVATFSDRLEDGLLPHPNMRVVEMTFQDRKRADVMLMDRCERTVIVECKQHSPSISDIAQLRGYMTQYKEQYGYGTEPRGILVHAGAPKLSPDIEEEASRCPVVEIVSYVLDVKFSRSVAIPSGPAPS